MKKLILLLIYTSSLAAQAATPITTEQAARFPKIASMLGNYEIIKTGPENTAECEATVRVFANTIRMGKKELQVMWVGPHLSFPLADITKSFPAEDRCSSIQVSGISDNRGWVEQRSTEFCENRRRIRLYKKASFNVKEETLRVILKRDGFTQKLCLWRKVD